MAFKGFQHIVETDVAGISEDVTGNCPIVSETYTDLLGRPIKSIGKGLVVKTIRYANGLKKVKVMKTDDN